MIEFEIKAMLSASEFVFLKTKRFHMGKVSLQKNYYYDTDSFELDKQGITCRIREKDGSFTATIKDHQSHGCSIETSRPAKDAQDASFFEGMGLSEQGKLTTIRTTCKTCDGFVAALDENRYLGTADYELEYEYNPDMQTELFQEIYELSKDLEYHNVIKSAEEFQSRFLKGKSKSKRFFERKKELQSLCNEITSFLLDT